MYKVIKSNSHNYNVQTFELVINLKHQWDKLHDETSIFRYKIDNNRERTVDGKYLLQLNPDRCTKRRTPELINNIMQPFDDNKFNFTRVSAEEIIFTLTGKDDDIHTILINASPISRYHSLLTPSVNKGLPQVVTKDSLELAIGLLFMTQDRELRIGFNSLCAFASVNHLHYHLLFENTTLNIETAKLRHIKGALNIIDDHHLMPAFCFEVHKETYSITVEEINKLLKFLLDNSIAHNILITNKKTATGFHKYMANVFIWPRKSTSGMKNYTAFNVAVCELSGWFPIFSEDAFNTLRSEDLEKELLKWRVDNFKKLCDQIELLY